MWIVTYSSGSFLCIYIWKYASYMNHKYIEKVQFCVNFLKTYSQWLSYVLIIWQFIKFISWYNFPSVYILKACINLITSKADLAMLNSSMVFACAIERKRFKISDLSFPIQLWDAFSHLSQDCSRWKSQRYTNDSEINI